MKRIGVVVLAALMLAVMAGPAAAYTFTRTLKTGDTGPDVRKLQVRVAGWFPQQGQSAMRPDGTYGAGTEAAVKEFQRFYGLEPDGIAGPSTYAVIDGLEDDDGSTLHFEWAEFKQNFNSRCSAQANAYAGTFKGGMVAPRRTKNNVRKIMWRLEALRAKAGGKAIAINSAYRGVAYNDCIGGARSSQHMYGTAVDNRMAEVSNRYERDLARVSQISGIGCYSSLSHNHFDIRLENAKLPSAQFWWWPDQDKSGRDLADDGKPCWGEGASAQPAGDEEGGDDGRTTASFIPSETAIESFADQPEWYGGLGD